MKTGIIGVGMIGGALAQVLHAPILYDTGKKIGSFEEVKRADIIFICVPTPYDESRGGFDLSIVEDVLSNLGGEKIIVIKSTVLPGTTENLQKQYPQHKILFNPEFLVEKTAKEDMKNPDRQLVGFTDKSSDVGDLILKMLPRAPFERTMPATEAEMVKYFGNTFLSVRVVFANQMYDLCRRLDVEYDLVKEAAAADPRIGDSHFDVFHNDYRGYGGVCLPKDTRSLIQKGREVGAPLELLEVVEELNNKLRQLPHTQRRKQ